MYRALSTFLSVAGGLVEEGKLVGGQQERLQQMHASFIQMYSFIQITTVACPHS
jgi:hypothetical protein